VQYLVDTNVLLRIADSASAQHSIAVEAIAKLLSRNDDLYVAPQVLAEFWVVASRPTNVNGLGWSVDDVELAVADFLKKFRILPETQQLFPEWHRLVVQYRVIGKQAHDARLAAIMNTNGLSHLVTFNANNFRAYPLTVLTPDEVIST
jgi:predicted nucleic acid-binding protein